MNKEEEKSSDKSSSNNHNHIRLYTIERGTISPRILENSNRDHFLKRALVNETPIYLT